jgi:hypothetical protein
LHPYTCSSCFISKSSRGQEREREGGTTPKQISSPGALSQGAKNGQNDEKKQTTELVLPSMTNSSCSLQQGDIALVGLYFGLADTPENQTEQTNFSRCMIMPHSFVKAIHHPQSFVSEHLTLNGSCAVRRRERKTQQRFLRPGIRPHLFLRFVLICHIRAVLAREKKNLETHSSGLVNLETAGSGSPTKTHRSCRPVLTIEAARADQAREQDSEHGS